MPEMNKNYLHNMFINEVKGALHRNCVTEITQLKSDLIERQQEISAERARINAFTSLKEGSTTGDAELIDARVDFKGNTHANVGEHIRTVGRELTEQIVDLNKKLITVGEYGNSTNIVNGYKLTDNSAGTAPDESRKILVYAVSDEPIYIKTKYGYQFRETPQAASIISTHLGAFEGLVQIESGANYIAIDVDVSNENEYGQFAYSVKTLKLESDVNKIKEEINKYDNSFLVNTTQLFNKDDENEVLINKYIQSGDGKMVNISGRCTIVIPRHELDLSKQRIIVRLKMLTEQMQHPVFFYTTDANRETATYKQLSVANIEHSDGSRLYRMVVPSDVSYYAITAFFPERDGYDFESVLSTLMVLAGDDYDAYTGYESYKTFDVEKKLSEYVSVKQDESDIGKYLKIDENGNVVPSEANNGDFLELHSKIKISVGSELINTTNDIVLGNGWSGSVSDGFVHTSGTEQLSISANTEVGKTYLLTVEGTGYAEDRYRIGFDGDYAVDPYNGNNLMRVALISNGNNIVIDPKDAQFTITKISLKPIGGDVELDFNATNIDISSMDSNVCGFYNTAIGKENLKSLIGGSRNISIGEASLRSLVNGTRNIGIGTFTMPVMEYGDRNIAIGADSMQFIQSASDNVLVGKATMEKNGGNQNVAIGNYAYQVGNGSCGVAIGYQAMSSADGDHSYSVGIGHLAGHKAGTGCVYIGRRAGYFSSGDNNVCVGYNAEIGNAKNNYQNCIVIGANLMADGSNQMIIGNASQSVKLAGKTINFNSDGTVTWSD